MGGGAGAGGSRSPTTIGGDPRPGGSIRGRRGLHGTLPQMTWATWILLIPWTTGVPSTKAERPSAGPAAVTETVLSYTP